MLKDIVCSMQIKASRASAKSNYQGREYSFCSLLCKEKFDSEPERYVKRENENKLE